MKRTDYVAELRKLREEDPKLFRSVMKDLQAKLEADGYEIEYEILYDN